MIRCWINGFETFFFGHRRAFLIALSLLTIFLLYHAFFLKVDAGFEKNVPLQHPYMQTYIEYQQDFGSANRLLLVVESKQSDIFNADFMRVFQKISDDVFFLQGVDRSQVSSLFTPNTRYLEVVEDGFEGGPVVPPDYDGSDEQLEVIKQNVQKAGIVGRLVANDFKSALISLQLLETDPKTGEKLDYLQVADQLEQQIRQQYASDAVDIHIIGFAKLMGDIKDGAVNVLFFFVLAIVITALNVLIYTGSKRMTLIPIACSVVAVIWQLGLLSLFDFGIDPMSILIPFLVFSIAVSHGVQMLNAVARQINKGLTLQQAAQTAFRRLLLPGSIALLSDSLGFITLYHIQIDIIRELAITASLGVAVIIVTNLLLLPLLMSYVGVGQGHYCWLEKRRLVEEKIWRVLDKLVQPRWAMAVGLLALLLSAYAAWLAPQRQIGDLHAGAPALWPESRYNQDTFYITDPAHYSIGVDLLSVIVEGPKEACTYYQYMAEIDRFQAYLENQPSVQSTLSLASLVKKINTGFNEGSLKWSVLSRNPQVLNQSVSRVPSSTGLLNTDCSVMPVWVFLQDHKVDSIAPVLQAVKDYQDKLNQSELKFRLASGPVGVIAATNEAVSASQTPMLLWVFGAIILLVLFSFLSVKAVVCIIVPLALVSLWSQALMVPLQIGLTVSTLPVVALGVGIGVDYGIYLFSSIRRYLQRGEPFSLAYKKSLRVTGHAVIFTGVTLAIGVSTWMFSSLKFQADMGLLLTFMFLVNMLAAMTVLPAIARLLYRG